MVRLARFVATIFYFIGIIGSIILFGKFKDINMFVSSSSEVTNTFIAIFFLANIAIGIVIHLLAEILFFIQLQYFEKKNDRVIVQEKGNASVNPVKSESTVAEVETKTNVNYVTNEKKELSLFYKTLLKLQNMFQKK